ncbi:hypothetical protein F5Y08DRAFT_327779 [Xylaria arbuscula]|nr:hypothetical protein F5Y08DRAFT_327779 [Xylaria arbuscula]
MESPAQPTPAGSPQSNSTEPSQEVSFLQSPPPQSCLDPKGDLYIIVGSRPSRSFKVCSRTVARTSIFWDKLLYGGFKESRKPCPQDDNQDWTVELPEDDPGAMELLFKIIHGRFHMVPRYDEKIDIDVLYNMTVITDKYDMTHILLPWARGWLKSTIRRDKINDKGWLGPHSRQRLWISWALGDRASFEDIAESMLLYSQPNYIYRADILKPPEIYDVIEKARQDTIKALLAPFSNRIERLINNDQSMCLHKSNIHPQHCIPSMLGTSIQSLRSLKKVKIESNVRGYDPCSHGPALKYEVERVLDYIPAFITEAHIRHLECQAKKTGVLK